MLILVSLLLQQRKLCDGRIEHHLLLGNFEAGGGATLVAPIDQIHSLLLETNRLLHNRDLRI